MFLISVVLSTTALLTSLLMFNHALNIYIYLVNVVKNPTFIDYASIFFVRVRKWCLP